MAELIGDQFKGLDMHNLIAGPLIASCEAQSMLAVSTYEFIKGVGFEEPKDGKTMLKTASFSFERGLLGEDGQSAGTETVSMNVPLLSVVKIPTIGIDEVNITFDMEVKSAESSENTKNSTTNHDVNAKLGFGPFGTKVNIKGSVTCNEKNTRNTDNSAKYHVNVHAKDFGTPEGLSRMLDILSTASTPVGIKRIAAGNASNDEPPVEEEDVD